MDERVGTIAIGDYIELAVISPADHTFAGILSTVDERGVIVSPSAKQLVDYPGVTAKNVAFFPWPNIAFMHVANEA